MSAATLTAPHRARLAPREVEGLGLCPMTFGAHQPHPYEGGDGVSCKACHKTWEWVDGVLVATWERWG